MKNHTTKPVIAFMAAVMLGSGFTLPAASQARVDSLNLTCAQAQALVQQRGVVILQTGPRVYERVVSGRRFCELNERAMSYRTATSDQRLCKVGKECRIFSRTDNGR